MGGKTKLELEVDLNPDGARIEVLIVDAAARQLMERFTVDLETLVTNELKMDLLALIDERLVTLIDEAIAGSIQRTTGWGDPVGEPITLREAIVEQAKAALDVPSDRGNYNRKETILQKVIRDAVDFAFDRDLRKAIDEAKAQVTAAVAQKGAEVLATTITKMAGG